MKKNHLILILLCFCYSVIYAPKLNIVYIGNSITEGALLKNPEVEAPPARANQYLGKHLNNKVNPLAELNR